MPARLRLIRIAAEISAATSSNGSVVQKMVSANSCSRRVSNSPMAANRAAIAADSARAAAVIASINAAPASASASASASNIRSIMPPPTDTIERYPQCTIHPQILPCKAIQA
nr:hypothetical protein [Mycolicibacterium setense]